MQIIRSLFEDINIPELPIHKLAFKRFTEYGDRIALIDAITDTKYTYNDLIQICHSLAGGLSRVGIRKGDIVAILSPNTPEVVFLFFSVFALGATIVPINPLYTSDEVSKILNDSKSKFMFVHGTKLTLVPNIRQSTPLLQTIIHNNDKYHEGVSITSLISEGNYGIPFEQFNAKDTSAVIPYSSGTTGLPKGVVLTHFNVVASVLQTSYHALSASTDPEGCEGTVDMAFLPFSHVYGMVVVMVGGLFDGHTLVTIPSFTPHTFLNAIQKYKVNRLPLVPPIVIFLANSPLVEKYDLSSVKRVGCGGAPLDKSIEIQLKMRLNVPDMSQGYGMTETSGRISCPPKEGTKAGSVGVLPPNTEAMVVDLSSGESLPARHQGELWVRGPQVMRGYLNQPQQTRECLNEQGWLKTGDIAYYDEDGFFYIVDRLKELIKCKGFQVAPAEMEALLLTHHAVADSAVVGVPDERAGELPRAYVVIKPGFKITAHDLAKFVEERVAPFKQLRGGVIFLKEIPKSPSGKILRRNLRGLPTLTSKSRL